MTSEVLIHVEQIGEMLQLICQQLIFSVYESAHSIGTPNMD